MTEQERMLYMQELGLRPSTADMYSYGYGDNALLPETRSALASRAVPNVPGADVGGTGVLDSIKSGLQNEGLMKGILGAGQLGLGMLSYLDNKQLMGEQLKSLRQNRQQAAKNFQDQQAQRSAINEGFRSALL